MVVAVIFFAGGGRSCLVVGLIPQLAPAASWTNMTAGENRAMYPVMAGDGGVTRRYFLEGIAFAGIVYSLVLLRGKP